MGGVWKVGAVAKASGITVRTLHHWDQQGVLVPSNRGPGGQREYTDEDLARLYVVLALRDLGLSLETIRACQDAKVDAQQVLVDHLAQIDARLRDLSRLRDRVARLVDAGIGDRDIADPAELLRLMRDTRAGTRAALDRYLSADQRAALAEGAAAAGPALPHLLELEWPALYRQADALRRDGAPPDDARVQRIVARLEQLSQTVGGDRANAGAAVRAAWRAEPAAMSGETEEVVAGWGELADFVEQARAISRAMEAST